MAAGWAGGAQAPGGGTRVQTPSGPEPGPGPPGWPEDPRSDAGAWKGGGHSTGRSSGYSSTDNGWGRRVPVEHGLRASSGHRCPVPAHHLPLLLLTRTQPAAWMRRK